MTVSNDFAHDLKGESGRYLGYLGQKENGEWVFIGNTGPKDLTAQDSSIVTDASFKANGVVRKVAEVES